jgi:hypothetical protein
MRQVATREQAQRRISASQVGIQAGAHEEVQAGL